MLQFQQAPQRTCLVAIVVCEIKMDQKWIQVLVILLFYQKMTSGTGDRTVRDGEPVEIHCQPADPFSMVMWFRVQDNSGMEFIASFSRDGTLKTPSIPLPQAFSATKIKQHILTLKSFKKAQDSGVYGCASIQSNTLKFGKVTRLTGEKVKVTTRAPLITNAKQNLPTTTTACVCSYTNKNGEASLSTLCSLTILGPLAGGCGLLLLLLIITIVYCNHVRTRRCPHHNKRKKRTMAPEKQMMTSRHM
ncbi:T-cell surface glycoprotein CD8 alpha chain [Toxotes jaculatrix]|uniref:T-cell surface glycoprotein CD8 alpha chain n=1 Tax=Toxotes jaculatrix TaxID=941984 RepID=UPI001B3B0653|nr:T-cell surface glycoprotein CD8 alpha chain [Toxotes jaculatrix]